MKTLPEILDDLQIGTLYADNTEPAMANNRNIAQKAIAKELMGCLPEKKLDFRGENSQHYCFNDALDEVRARLTAFIGHKEK